MKVILLERVERLGALGDVVTVKDGFARNFLLPNAKALRANAENLKVFESRRGDIEASNAKAREVAAKSGDKLDGSSYIMIRQAGESGHLYGSVSGRDVADAVNAEGGKGRQGRPLDGGARQADQDAGRPPCEGAPAR